MTNDWVPFGLTEEQTEQYRVLVDGVPSRMREPLLAWMKGFLSQGTYNSVMADRTRALQLRTDAEIGLFEGLGVVFWENYVPELRRLEETVLLRVADAILASGWRGSASHGALEDLLRASRSKWMVGERNGRPGLVAREPEGVQDIVESTVATSGTAGQVLARAWGKVQALIPDDPGAYADAVKAVEIVAQPLVEPENREATLGGIAGVMRNHRDWRLPLREHQHAPTGEMLVAMCRSLYRGHVDRHGSDDYRDVTHEEAHAAVVLAATLVSWFSSGAVQRRP